MKQLARILRRHQTDAEKQIWRHLRNRGLAGFKFRRQYSVGPYVVDFVCLERWLVVEIDGGQHMEQQQKDERRTASLESHGFRVVRFWNNDVLQNIETVLSVILDALNAPSSPALLPEGEGCTTSRHE
jgi:very-short-patch-repair endonuclease